jgi:ParB family transcriptional regulator, chromosome partitioning protein
MDPITKAGVEQVPISKIVVGVRRRQKLGDIRGLSRSIKEHGLLHPIIVRNGNELVAGQRRLEACKRLGWTSISTRRVETMSDEDLRAIEFEENAARLALSDYEGSKQRLAQIRQAEADLKAEENPVQTVQGSSKGSRGPAKQPGSKTQVAEVTGISRPERRRIEDHVALAEQFPFMQKNGWVQHQVLGIRYTSRLNQNRKRLELK